MVLKKWGTFLPVACVALSMACSSGGSGSSSSSSTVTTASLQSVNNLPDFNVENLDSATSSSETAQLTRYVEDGGQEQRFSRAGCELRSNVEEFKYQLRELRSNICIVKKMEANAGMVVGDGEFNYYNMDFEVGEAPGDSEDSPSANMSFSARVRIGVINDRLQMALCTNDGGDGFYQQMALNFGVNQGRFDGVIKNVYPSFNDPSEFDKFSMEAALATDDPEKFQEGDEAAFLAQMDTAWGHGSIGLDIQKENDVLVNTVNAAFNSGSSDAEWGSWSSIVYGKYDASQGCSIWASTGQFPGTTVSDVFPDGSPEATQLASAGFTSTDKFCWKRIEEEQDCSGGCDIGDFVEAADGDGMCTFTDGGEDSTECFSFQLNEGSLGFFQINPASEGTYFGDVSTQELGTISQPEIAYDEDETWDCELPAGEAFVEIDPSEGTVAEAFLSCFEIGEGSGRSMESCHDQENHRFAEDELGQEFDEPEHQFGGEDSGDGSGQDAGESSEGGNGPGSGS